MKILHTSDWHLGKKLYGKNRDAEFGLFLDWLLATLRTEAIDALLIAGDIFDTTTPGNTAQEQYYRFLTQVPDTGCRHVVIIAGNHDSPTFLEAPKTLLKTINVHVIGHATGSDDVLTLYDTHNQAELIVAAVPYLRDRTIRQVQTGESISDKSLNLKAGIAQYYAEIAEAAEHTACQSEPRLPIVAMGHLFAAGGQTLEGDGVRELYVGSLAHVSAQVFSDSFDYVALGHLHVPQKVADQQRIRYSGSPIAMGFGEARQQKQVLVVDFETINPENPLKPQVIPVPCFQALQRITGDLSTLLQGIATLENPKTWIEAIYTGEDLCENLRERLDECLLETEHELLRVENQRLVQRMLTQSYQQETLEQLTPTDVFERLLTVHAVPEHQQADLKTSYQEILNTVLEEA